MCVCMYDITSASITFPLLALWDFCLSSMIHFACAVSDDIIHHHLSLAMGISWPQNDVRYSGAREPVQSLSVEYTVEALTISAAGPVLKNN